MRLIDADALIEDLEYDVELDARYLDDTNLVGIGRTFIQFDKDCKQNAIDLLRNTPTAEPGHKTGKWIDNDIDPEAWNYCSICGEQAIDLYDFCPNCGADMRSQAKEPSINPCFGCDDYIIHPCRGCDDYIAPNGCKSNGGCGAERGGEE